MSALDGFYATWNDARNTFGEGTPQGGSQIDASPTFSRLGEDVQAAAPGDTWTGAGSEAYGGANKKHGENLTKLADLDQRLAAQLDQAADVVTTGRGNLDAVRQWVTDAANSVPPGKQRDELLMRIANSGLGQVSEIVQTSNDANNTIRDNMNRLKPEFQAIGFKEEQGAGDDPLNAQGEGEDKPGEENEESAEEQGKKDGEALAEQAGTPSAYRDPAVLDQVADNLPGSPLTQEQTEALARGEEVDDVPPETLAYYREFYQAAGKDGLLLLDRHLESQEAAGNAEAGQQRDKLANGLTVTSNENIVERNPDGTIADRGGYDQLPPDLREMLEVRRDDPTYPGWETVGPTEAKSQHVADVVQFSELMGEANPGYQPGSRLGTEMYMKSADMVEYSQGGWGMTDTPPEAYERAANSLADVAGRNNAASAQIWSGTGDDLPDGYNREETVRTLMGHDWSQSGTEGTGAATLLDWMTEDMNRPVGDPIGDRARLAFTEVPHMLAPDDNEAVRNTMRESFALSDAMSTEMSQLLGSNLDSLATPGLYQQGFETTGFDNQGNPILSAVDGDRLLELGSYSEEGRVTLTHAVESAQLAELREAMKDNPGNVGGTLDDSAMGSLSGRIDDAMLDAVEHRNEVNRNEVDEANAKDAVWRAKVLGAELAGIATDELAGKIPGSGPITDVTGLEPGEAVEQQIKDWIAKPEYHDVTLAETQTLEAASPARAHQSILQAAFDNGQLPAVLMPGGEPLDLSGPPLAENSPEGQALKNFLESRGLEQYVKDYTQSYDTNVGE